MSEKQGLMETLTREDWRYQLQRCYKMATMSPDPSTQNAAVILNSDYIVVGQGVNEFPTGVVYEEARWQRPDKYMYVEHAERNAIFNAARWGSPLKGTTMVCPWAACTDCARAIIQSGISKLVTHRPIHEANSNPHWIESVSVAFTMLNEANVEIVMIDEIVNGDMIRVNGNFTSF